MAGALFIVWLAFFFYSFPFLSLSHNPQPVQKVLHDAPHHRLYPPSWVTRIPIVGNLPRIARPMDL